MSFTGQLRPYQEEPAKRMKDRGSMLLALEQGTGKAQPLSSLVLTPTGWRTMGSLSVGDEVLGPAGDVRRVVGVFPQGLRDVAEVTFSDGAKVLCDLDHLWAVNDSQRRRRGLPWKTMSLREILDEGLRRGATHRHYVPLTALLDLPEVALPVDPYVLGLLLGDGGLTGGSTPRFSTVDDYIVRELASRLGEGHRVVPVSGCDFRIAGVGYRNNELLESLRTLGLMGKGSAEKFIPQPYLLASAAQRLALLQGLMDTDGWVTARQPTSPQFASCSPALADGVADLVRSLGGSVRRTTKRTPGLDSHVVAIALPSGMNPFLLPRKADVYRPRVEYLASKYMRSVAIVGKQEVQCIKVDADDGLYITDGYTVTHNTTVTISVLEDMMDEEVITEPGLVVCLSTLKYQWAAKIEEFTSGTSIPLVIDGTPKQREEQYKRALNWEADYVIINYEQAVNEWQWVSRLPRGFIVVDEASFIRGFRAKRSKAIKSLKSPVRYALTGTPIENGKPEEIFSIMEFVDPTLFGRFDLFDKTFIKRNDNGWVTRYRNIPTFHAKLSEAMIRKRADDPDVAPFMPKSIEREPLKVRLDKASGRLYSVIAHELLEDLDEAARWGGTFDLAANYGKGAAQADSARDRLKGRIGQKMMALEMLSDHPELLRISAAKYDQRVASNTGTSGSAYAADLRDRGLLDGVTKAPKMQALMKWIPQTLEADPRNKIVVFSRFVEMILLMSQEIGIDHETYTGRMNAKQKDAALTRFQTDPNCRVLLASDAGGFGLDIPQANHTMNYDLPDGAGAADQRDTRTRRTSSEFPSVFLHWLLVEDSLEEHKRARLQQKRNVANAFIDARGLTAKGGVVLDVGTVREFLMQSDLVKHGMK